MPLKMDSELLRGFFDQIPIPIVLLEGPEHRVTFANPRYIQMFIGDQPFLGEPVAKILPEVEKQGFLKLVDAVYTTGIPYNGKEARFVSRDEKGNLQDYFFNLSYTPLRESDGSIRGVLATVYDVTQQVRTRVQIEAAAQQSSENERDLADILESMSDAFLAVDKNWIITRVNQNHINTTFIPREEQIGANFLDLFFSYDALKDTIYWRSYHKAMKDRVIVQFEDYYQPFDIHTDVRVHPKADGGLAIFFTDISERKQNEKNILFERQKLELIFQLSPAAMVLWQGPDLVFERVNPQYQKIFPKTQLIGRPLFEALPELKGQIYEKAVKQVFETGIPYVGHEVETRLRRDPEGPLETAYYDFAYVRLVDAEGGPYGVYDHAIDVTDRVIARKDLEKAKIIAEQANATKSAFLANMSHEIRTPLNAILGFAELLKDPHTDGPEKDRFLEIILRSGKTLTRIIDDILDLAKVESGKLVTEEVYINFPELIEEVMDLFREKSREKGITLTLAEPETIPPVICSDPTRLRQILMNIMGNAVKFTDTGGVRISVRTLQEDERSEVQINIEDSGVGIETEQQARLFQPFVQADNTNSRKYGGTGLGLVLSLRLAKALGGTIEILKSEPGQGSTFRLSFKAKIPEQTKAPNETVPLSKTRLGESATKALAGLHILLVDDSIDNLFLANRVLVKNGATVATVNNGKEAFEAASKHDYDVILMDLQMPVMDGYEATRALRSSGYTKPIIALTAHAMAEEVARTHAVGCDAHLTKPLNQKELVRTIVEHVS